MTVKASVSLSEQQDRFARSLLAKGQYSSLSAVVQRGLGFVRLEFEREEVELSALRTLLEKRAKGPFISAEELSQRTEAMIESKLRALGL